PADTPSHLHPPAFAHKNRPAVLGGKFGLPQVWRSLAILRLGPAVVYLAGMSAETYAGVELGGTKCIAILASGPERILARETVPTTTPGETLGRLGDILSDWRSQGFAALGIGSFGPLDLGRGTIASTPKPGWRNADVKRRLEDAAGVSAAFDTDVNG